MSDPVKDELDASLARAKLTVVGEEYDRMLRSYPTIQALLAELRLPEARYCEPAMVYVAPVSEE